MTASLGAWRLASLPAASSWDCLTYGNGLFVSGGGAGDLATSPDGITWTSRTLPFAQSFGIAYGNGIFVSIGQSTATNTSTDGVTWTSHATFPLSGATCLTYGNGLFVALTNAGTCATSPDGVTWTTRTVPSGSYKGIAYGNGVFVSSSITSKLVITSVDGITWTSNASYTAYSTYIGKITYGNGIFVGVSWSKNLSTDPNSYVSTDGINWTAGSNFDPNPMQDVTYGNGLFVTVFSGGGYLYTSADGINWQQSTTAKATNQWYHIAYGAGTFVVTQNSGGTSIYAYVSNVVSSATTYRYIFTDVLTGSQIGELSMTGVSFDQKLNTAGTLNAHILLSGVDTAKLNVAASTIPMRCAIHVDRNGTIIWGGVIWARNYDSKSQTLNITAREWLSYFEKRKITNTIAFSAIDQMAIAQQLVINAQNAAYGNVGCLLNQDPLSTLVSGTTITQTYYGYELKNVFNEIQALSQQAGGFDFAIDCYYNGAGQIVKSFNTYYPRRGIAYSSSNASIPVFELPAGNIVEYTYPEDGSLTANTVYVQGAGSNEGKLIATASDTTKFSAGWPLIEDAVTYNNITDTGVLAKLATGKLNAISYPPTTMTVVAPPYQDPMFGTYRVGDDVRVRITDQRFPTGSDATYRIIALAVTAGEKQPEQVKLTLALGGTTI